MDRMAWERQTPAPGGWSRLARWVLVGLLACVPFACGLLAILIAPTQLRSSLSPWLAAGILLLGVPLWFVVAEALATALRRVISSRRAFVAVDALLGFVLLVVLYSMVVAPLGGAALCAGVAAVAWWVTAPITHRRYRRASGRPEPSSPRRESTDTASSP